MKKATIISGVFMATLLCVMASCGYADFYPVDEKVVAMRQKESDSAKEALLKQTQPVGSWVRLSIPLYYSVSSCSADSAGLYAINTDGTDNYKICDGILQTAVISPDGKSVLFLVVGREKNSLYVFDRMSRKLTLVREVNPERREGEFLDRVRMSDIAWAPDSRRFVYMYSTNDYVKGILETVDECHLFDLTTGQDTLLFKPDAVLPVRPSYAVFFWSSDNAKLYYIEPAGGKYYITVFDVAGRKKSVMGEGIYDYYKYGEEEPVKIAGHFYALVGSGVVKQRGFSRLYSREEAISEKGETLSWVRDGVHSTIYIKYRDSNGLEREMLKYPETHLPSAGLAWLPGGRYALVQIRLMSGPLLMIIEPSSHLSSLLANGEYDPPLDCTSLEKWVY